MKYLLRLFCLLLGFVLLTGCVSGGQSSGDVRTVTVSMPVMKYFVDRLTCGGVAVNVMIPRGADHDTYTPRPSQMMSLASSQAYIAFGTLEFEVEWRERFASSAPSMAWERVDAGIELIENEHGDGDPHFWLSPRQSLTMVRTLSSTLARLYPDLSSAVDSARDVLLREIEELDNELTRIASQKPGQMFVIYHPSLSYVARDYGLRQLSMGAEGIAPQPKRFAELIDSARAGEAEVVFLQQGYTPDRVQATADALGATIVVLQPEAEEYLTTMEAIINSLR